MLQNDIRRADAVRHVSVDAGTRTADRADRHGHRPQNGTGPDISNVYTVEPWWGGWSSSPRIVQTGHIVTTPKAAHPPVVAQ